MSSDGLIHIINTTLTAPWIVLFLLKQFAVPGTRQAYVATTALILVSVLKIIANLIQAAIYLQEDKPFDASIAVAASLLLGWFVKDWFHDDNWFNRKWKKLKKDIKNFQESLQSVFVPAPAPG